MPHVKRVVQTIVLSAAVGGAGGLSAGCQETAATAAAVQVSKAAVDVLAGVPDWVRQQVRAMTERNNLNWGQPDRVHNLDFAYVVTFPTPVEELRRNNGQPRTLVIHKSGNPGLSL